MRAIFWLLPLNEKAGPIIGILCFVAFFVKDAVNRGKKGATKHNIDYRTGECIFHDNVLITRNGAL